MFTSLSIQTIQAIQTIQKFSEKITVQLQSTYFSLFIALTFVCFFNVTFFSEVNRLIESDIHGVMFRVNITLVLWLLTFIVLSLVTIPYVAKPAVRLLFIIGASVAYFTGEYGIVIHRLMIQNLVETDVSEVHALLSVSLILYIFFLGILPSVLLTRVNINFAQFGTECWVKVKWIFIALTVCLALIFSMSADYASFFRNHKNIRQMANPLNFIYASASYLTTSDRVIEVKPIESDARVSQIGAAHIKPTLFILVVGETARADHFGINGYHRNTTPLLAQHQIINFSNVTSCGTETAVSLPCMFSVLGRGDYSDARAKSQEGLLDVISHAGIAVLWRDNNSSCKGTCNRVAYEDMQHLDVPEKCTERECFDKILLHQLDNKVAEMKGRKTDSKVIVLHQKGSHGPDYFNRYPQAREYFSPACKSNQLHNCTNDEVINAFDNTIRYTDYFLDSTINWLTTKNGEYNTSLLYLSDHGESLGENHLYLHGMPYAIAPREQKEVPFFLWLSKDFAAANAIDSACLKKMGAHPYSHDNLFHTVLGLLNVETRVYRAELDMIKPCRQLF